MGERGAVRTRCRAMPSRSGGSTSSRRTRWRRAAAIGGSTAHFEDKAKGDEFFGFFRRLQNLYDILSPEGAQTINGLFARFPDYQWNET